MSFERTHYTKEWMAVARAAIAHLSKRPEGLPTAEELDRIAEAAFDANDGTKFAATRAILDYLRPWLRNPAGCELDVTIDAAMKAYLNECMVNSGRMAECRGDGISGVLDLCRSRIRPVYECKECAKLRDEVTFWKRENVTSNNKMLSARAALEDE
jgi:hypothetical protein